MTLRKHVILDVLFLLLVLVTMMSAGCRSDQLSSSPNTDSSLRPANSPAKNSTPIENDPRRINGTVVHISDGDTFILENAIGERTTVRIHAIDAPELAQSFGKESREELRALIVNQQVVVRKQKKDQFNRIVGDVFLGDKNIGLDMVALGYAWHFKQYQKEQSPNDRKLFTDAETTAHNSRLGLWREDNPTAPQEYRRTHNTRR